jgi:hypothetical protein
MPALLPEAPSSPGIEQLAPPPHYSQDTLAQLHVLKALVKVSTIHFDSKLGADA